MHISRLVFIFLALIVFVSCSLVGEKSEVGKAKSAESVTKTAVTGTAKNDSAPKRTASKNKTTSETKKKEIDFNGITQFHGTP